MPTEPPDTSANDLGAAESPRVAYIGCWYKNDMYSHNCVNLVDSLRDQSVAIDVITSNCRCFSKSQTFTVPPEELINGQCNVIVLPHAPQNPSMRRGRFKYLAVKILRVDLLLGMVRGVLFYRRARRATVLHYDQVLEAFGFVPLSVLLASARVTGKPVTVTVHEIDPFQKNHPWLNRLYRQCAAIFVYSDNMRNQLVELGLDAAQISVIKYGLPIPHLLDRPRTQYIFFGGHRIMKGKGYEELIDALAILSSKGRSIRLVIYFGEGCHGLDQARELAAARGVAHMIEWRKFLTPEELSTMYQSSKACIVPYTGGSARHPLSCAMANATPVIATRTVDIQEYLGDLGLYVEGTGASIAQAISQVEEQLSDFRSLGTKLRERAIAELNIEKIARDMRCFYSRLTERN